MVVQHNITAMNANRYFGINNKKLSKSLEKLSSGYAINRAGDNAAGLAVSEKMRSQIAGMTQAVKNAQDGISMVQTYEGALTETDSILQRMKTLATQIANGGYDDPVDRTAAQQEFYQLNDELNQIADTDYNGVVVLNGGVMADGAVADKNGLIDYANQPARAAAELMASDINTLDGKMYNSKMAAANALWDNLGLDESVESVDLTFTYNKATDTWSITDSDNSTALANKDNITIERGATGTDGTPGTKGTTGKNNGGFSITNSATTADGLSGAVVAAKTYEYANVVLDSTELVDGDTVTLTFTRPNVNNSAPENVAVKDGSVDVKLPKGSSSTLSDPSITVNGGTKKYKSTNGAAVDGTNVIDMTEEAKAAFDGLDGLKIECTYVDKTDKTYIADSYKITLADGKSVEIKNAVSGTAGAVTGSIVSEDGVKYSLALGDDGSLTISDSAGIELLKIGAGTVTGDAADATLGNETITQTFEIAMDTATYSKATEPKVTIDDSKDYSVSQSNAFKHSEAKMTYKDHLILQVGGRTKDAVDFTFQYDSDAIGDLVADLNCTAKGLGTDILDIKTQESANYAVDKIDQALNKVSLVRGTFGAIQNRLDHKIDNLNVTVENLTDAESRIRDTNMAEEMMNFTKNQILSQASQSMLAQANQLPQSVLQLLQ